MANIHRNDKAKFSYMSFYLSVHFKNMIAENSLTVLVRSLIPLNHKAL